MKKQILLVLAALSVLSGCKEDDQASPRTFLIPEGYTGWIKVDYEGTMKASTSQKETKVLKADSKGVIKTSDKHIHEGWAESNYYYVNKEGKKTKLNPDKMIHGNSSGRESEKETDQFFFVGTDAEFQKNQYQPAHK
ncbi:hypothetical protein CEF21_09990 [Bacillus sp. FJAT-42376]|uniref:DUF6843 domain-containing protein n=1 Tax=Bacillus sp. FJAT-42376 TaxID=2014076 RepID=UPI000F4F6D58|nr:hypothetical protein [Bacillus sp. FJAT-42376]AZB42591.1 hypothetical protein CEF21_09990 [Bacillus sp. FJAT-42376]